MSFFDNIFNNKGVQGAIDAATGNEASNFVIITKVLDNASNTPLPNANIVIVDKYGKERNVNGNTIKRKTDTVGRFIIPIALPYSYLKISFVGYQSIIEPAASFKDAHTVYLQPVGTALKDVVVRGKRIIKTAPKKKKAKWLPVIVIGAVLVTGAIVYYLNKNK